jgi:uncharacterized caspase-like protein
VIILDCCFSGAFTGGLKSNVAGEPLLLEKLHGETSAQLTSSGIVEYSFDDFNNSNSLFTHFLVQGAQTGEADGDEDGRIEVAEWFNYAEQQVRQERPEQR